MRKLCLTALLLAALAGGCGGDSADAEETVSSAISGLADGDGQQVCENITPAAQRRILALLADGPLGLPSIRAKTCAEGIVKLYAKLTEPQRAVLRDGEVGEAKVEGDKAEVRVIGLAMRAELQKIDDRWMITGGLFQIGGRTVK